MTDEEKKAIVELKEEINKPIEVPEDKFDTFILYNIESARTILNLIEKQSKEIEELKAISEYREKIIKGLGLKTLPKTITGFRELIENNDKKWEDKIKAKIEEIKQRREKDGECELALHGFQREGKIEVLQSLLEKE